MSIQYPGALPETALMRSKLISDHEEARGKDNISRLPVQGVLVASLKTLIFVLFCL